MSDENLDNRDLNIYIDLLIPCATIGYACTALTQPPSVHISKATSSLTPNLSNTMRPTPRLALITSQLHSLKPSILQSGTSGSSALPRSRASKSRGLKTMAPTEVKRFDYIVIGGGSGGSGTARRASGWYGAKTLLIENGISGGCCVNVG